MAINHFAFLCGLASMQCTVLCIVFCRTLSTMLRRMPCIMLSAMICTVLCTTFFTGAKWGKNDFPADICVLFILGKIKYVGGASHDQHKKGDPLKNTFCSDCGGFNIWFVPCRVKSTSSFVRQNVIPTKPGATIHFRLLCTNH